MKYAIAIPAVASAAVLAFTVLRANPAPEQAKSITFHGLNQLQVIGWLGQPLGNIVTVEGVVADDSYERSKAQVGQTLLLIQAVNGKKLPESVVFDFGRATNDIAEPKGGATFKYIGYETGGFTGTPAGVFEYTGPYCTTGYGFTTDFVVLRDELKPRKAVHSDGTYPPPATQPRSKDAP